MASREEAGTVYEPALRSYHSSVVVEDKLFVWGGKVPDEPTLCGNSEKNNPPLVEVFYLTRGRWEQLLTIGTPPPGIWSYSTCVLEGSLIFFGGGSDHGSSCFNSLYELDAESLKWSEIFPTIVDGGPMRKINSGLVPFEDDEEKLLFVFGGKGPNPDITRHQVLYEECDRGMVCCNECDIFDPSKRKWIVPTITGDVPLPLHSFSLSRMSADTAILFGGVQKGKWYNHVYAAVLKKNSVHWSKLSTQGLDGSGDRRGHAAICVYSSLLLVMGGMDKQDCWVLNIQMGQWLELTVPGSVSGRCYHSLSSIALSPTGIWLMVVGGTCTHLSSPVTAILEINLSSTGHCNVVTVLDGPDYAGYIEKLVSMFLTAYHQDDLSCPMPLKPSSKEVQFLSTQSSIPAATVQLQADLPVSLSHSSSPYLEVSAGHMQQTSSQVDCINMETSSQPRPLCSTTHSDGSQPSPEDIPPGPKKMISHQEIEQKLKGLELSEERKLYMQAGATEKGLGEQDAETLENKQQHTIESLQSRERISLEQIREITRLKLQLRAAEDQLEEVKELAEVEALNFRYQLSEKDKDVKTVAVQADYLDVDKDKLRGVDICGETVIEIIGDKHHDIEWPGYGFRIVVPEGAIPPGETVSLAVKAILGGEFQLPENTQLVSTFYWMSTSQPFCAPVSVQISHCAIIRSEAATSRFKFILGSSSQKTLPYTFSKVHGLFTPNSQYATVTGQDLSLFGAVFEGQELHSETYYVGHGYYKPLTGPGVWQFHFVICKDSEALMKAVEQTYCDWTQHHTQTIELAGPPEGCSEEEAADKQFFALKISEPGENEPKDWIVSSTQTLKFTKRAVDAFTPDRSMPVFQLCLQWDGKSAGEEIPALRRRINFDGVKAPQDFFTIHIYPQAYNSFATSSAAKVPAGLKPHKSYITLGPSNFRDLVICLQSVRDWRKLGILLGIQYATLKKISVEKESTDDCKMAMFDEWLRSGKASKQALIVALQKLGEHAVIDSVHNNIV